jgi:protein gp37
MENSNIEWCDHTFNPWIGCTKVSPGCANCYAEAQQDHRYHRVKWGKHQARKPTSDTYWKQPLKWDRKAKALGVRKRVFCASLADVFDTEVSDVLRHLLFELIYKCQNLDWLILTKRPQKAVDFLGGTSGAGLAAFVHNFPNVWMGVSVEDQIRADERIPELLKIPAKVRFLSMEPLLGPVDVSRYFDCDTISGCSDDWFFHPINWVIVGGESGTDAREMKPEWAQSLRDQCQAAEIPFLFKQWGTQNKKAAGRILDGREWNEFPIPQEMER